MGERALNDGASSAEVDDRGGGRARILEAARTAFASRGYDGASTASIARAAGVTQPLVHYHFATKEELWRAVVLEALAELDAFGDEVARSAGDGATPSHDDVVAQIEASMHSFVRFVAAHPDIGRILIVDGARANDRLEWLIDEALGWRFRDLETALQNGVDAGLFKPVPAGLAALAFVAAAGYPFQIPEVLRRVFGLDADDPDTVEAHAAAVAEIFLRGMLRAPKRETVDA
jgi:AcrR family transcriptional regulator